MQLAGIALQSRGMTQRVDTSDPRAVAGEVERLYREMFPGGDSAFVPEAVEAVVECFRGRFAGFQAVDTRYHDIEHTMQGTLCLARLLHGRSRAGALPVLDERMARLGLWAILLHDTGYLKRLEDTAGTGAKYTVTHVSRSADFAAGFLARRGCAEGEIRAVQNMIRCTGINANLRAIPFGSEAERITGYALATADLLGQMSAEDYLEKLPVLYAEFAEAARFTGDQSQFVASFASAEDLVRRTPAFWEEYVLPKLKGELGGLYRFLSDPYPDGRNDYVERVEANMAQLKRKLAERGG